jgi:hypothetical protein
VARRLVFFAAGGPQNRHSKNGDDDGDHEKRRSDVHGAGSLLKSEYQWAVNSGQWTASWGASLPAISRQLSALSLAFSLRQKMVHAGLADI